MKKFVSSLCIVVLLSLMMFSSCSFGNSERAAERVMNKISKAMDSIHSYEVDSELEITAYVSAEKIEVSGSSSQIYLKEKNSDLYYFSKNNTNIKLKGEENNTSTLQAFCEGEYYFAYSIDDKDTKLRSNLTENEFLEFEERIETDLLKGYKNISHKKSENNSHTVTLSGYNDTILKSANASYGFPFENAGGRIVDLCVTITADSGYLVDEISVEYIFSNSEFSGNEKMTFSSYNKAERAEEALLNPLNYISVSDARVARELPSLLNDKKVSREDEFDFTYELLTDSTVSHKEQYDVSYGVDGGNYYFEMGLLIDGPKQKITYKNDELCTDGVSDFSYNDFKAKQIIDSLIDPFSFVPIGITDIEKTEVSSRITKYKFTFDPSYSFFKDVIDAMLTQNYMYGSITVEVTVRDCELQTMEYNISATSRAGAMIRKNIIKTKLEFKE